MSTTASGPAAAIRSLVWMPPQVTPIACTPAAFAAAMSKGASPTYAVSSGVDVEPVERDQDLVRVWLAARRLVRADDHVHQLAEAERLERELDDVVAFGADDPEPPAFAVERLQQVEHPRKRLQLGVEGFVELAIGERELVGFRLVEFPHLLFEVAAADLRHQDVVREAPAEHGLGGVPVGGQDHPAGVDDRAVEIEQDHREPHVPDANDVLRSRTPPRPGRDPTAARSTRPRRADGPRATARRAPAPARSSSRRGSAPCAGGSSRR